MALPAVRTALSSVRVADPPRPLVALLLLVLDPGVDAVNRAIETRLDRMLAEAGSVEVENLRILAGYHAGTRRC